jgi:hypothetical protein
MPIGLAAGRRRKYAHLLVVDAHLFVVDIFVKWNRLVVFLVNHEKGRRLVVEELAQQVDIVEKNLHAFIVERSVAEIFIVGQDVVDHYSAVGRLSGLRVMGQIMSSISRILYGPGQQMIGEISIS